MLKRLTVPVILLSAMVCAVSGINHSPLSDAAPLPANTQTVNLASQATIDTQASEPDTHFAQQEQTYAASLLSTSAWHAFYYQGTRDITIHLQKISTVSSLSIQFQQEASLGVFYPNQVDFQVLKNGTWYSLGTRYSAIPKSDKRITTQYYSVHTGPVVGQDFRLHFAVGVWSFARNLSILGTPGSSASPAGTPALVPVKSTPVTWTGPLSPSSPRAHGIRNMLLVYATDPNHLWSQSDFLPTVGYMSRSGQISGHMFDTIQFMAGAGPDTAASWQAYLQNLFTAGRELSALDAAVGQVNQTLGTPNYKEKVVIMLPYAAYGDGYFGNVNGEALNFSGSPADPNALNARSVAMRWFVSSFLSSWNQANYANLELSGLYWGNESIPTESPGEMQLIQDASTLARQDGLPLFWIPFYGAQGATAWQSAGFTAAWLQPNFAEQGTNPDITRLDSSVTIAKKYGMGTELELLDLTPTSINLYEESLLTLEQDGMGAQASHALYAGGHFFVDAANSSDMSIRPLYDQTYNFLQLSPSSP